MADKVYLAKIKLKEAVEAHGNPVKELELREPTAKDLMSIAMPDEERTMEGALQLAAKLANVPPSTIESLGRVDAMEVMKVVNPLYLDVLATFAP